MAGPQAQRPQQGESSASGAPPVPSVSSAPPAPPAPSASASQPPGGGVLVPATIEQHIEIPGDGDGDDEQPNEENQTPDVEHGAKRVRHRHHQLPLYIRIINYIRNAWTGVKFSSSNGKFQ